MEDNNWIVSLCAWTINVFFLVMVILRTMIHGEPFIERHSKEASIYWKQRKQADYDMNNVCFLKSHLFSSFTAALFF